MIENLGRERKQGNKFVKFVSNFLLVLLLSACGLIAYLKIFYIFTPVYGDSMLPTIVGGEENFFNDEDSTSGDYVFVHQYSSIKRGDIVVANIRTIRNSVDDYFIVKRCLAVAGERIDFQVNENNEIVTYINGRLLDEPYVKYPSTYEVNEENVYLRWINYILNNIDNIDYNYLEGGLLIEDGYVFLAGDNRQASYDCRYYGPILESDVVGRVDYILPRTETSWISAFKIIMGQYQDLLKGFI